MGNPSERPCVWCGTAVAREIAVDFVPFALPNIPITPAPASPMANGSVAAANELTAAFAELFAAEVEVGPNATTPETKEFLALPNAYPAPDPGQAIPDTVREGLREMLPAFPPKAWSTFRPDAIVSESPATPAQTFRLFSTIPTPVAPVNFDTTRPPAEQLLAALPSLEGVVDDSTWVKTVSPLVAPVLEEADAEPDSEEDLPQEEATSEESLTTPTTVQAIIPPLVNVVTTPDLQSAPVEPQSKTATLPARQILVPERPARWDSGPRQPIAPKQSESAPGNDAWRADLAPAVKVELKNLSLAETPAASEAATAVAMPAARVAIADAPTSAPEKRSGREEQLIKPASSGEEAVSMHSSGEAATQDAPQEQKDSGAERRTAPTKAPAKEAVAEAPAPPESTAQRGNPAASPAPVQREMPLAAARSAEVKPVVAMRKPEAPRPQAALPLRSISLAVPVADQPDADHVQIRFTNSPEGVRMEIQSTDAQLSNELHRNVAALSEQLNANGYESSAAAERTTESSSAWTEMSWRREEAVNNSEFQQDQPQNREQPESRGQQQQQRRRAFAGQAFASHMNNEETNS
jgi:hypothetical protein